MRELLTLDRILHDTLFVHLSGWSNGHNGRSGLPLRRLTLLGSLRVRTLNEGWVIGAPGLIFEFRCSVLRSLVVLERSSIYLLGSVSHGLVSIGSDGSDGCRLLMGMGRCRAGSDWGTGTRRHTPTHSSLLVASLARERSIVRQRCLLRF